ncbi:hypothetical protein N0V82_006442 [Gnomoniopsis sp. IMI 355080]|nr:hypothetical protein N0V82_006442 [Gnomoniopsis sp. IMI 355080]
MGSSSPIPEVSSTLGQLNNPEARALIDTIDSLRDLQVGEIVDLPQIIVVGDQSSGKSSVLEAISRVKFPIDSDLCTRFATELILRKAVEGNFVVSIQFANDAPQAQPFQKANFDMNALPDVVKEAKQRMGIRHGSKSFSKDILRVEISGPDYYPLTLVDLPGIFHSATSDQSVDGKEVVDQLIESYMCQKNCIILAVVSANNQLANQIVVTRAKRHDPESKRTIGVITKPDLAGQGSANEKKYLDLCKGLEPIHKLPLGWHVLCNSSDQERSDVDHDRDMKERRFFQTGAWSSVSPLARGVETLRKRLSKVLFEHIRASLPGLIRDIQSSLDSRQEILAKLGRSRCTLEDMRVYLVDIAEEFQRLARDAVEGKYTETKFFGDLHRNNRKLRAEVRFLNQGFDAVMVAKGSTYTITLDVSREADDSDESVSLKSTTSMTHLPYSSVYDGRFPEPIHINESTLNSKLESFGAYNQGRELPGTPNGDLAFQLFKKQAEPWAKIATFHTTRVLKFCKAFVDQLFEYIIGDESAVALQAILKNCVDPFFEEKRSTMEAKLKELLRPYADGYGLTLEREFHIIMSQKSLRRQASRFLSLLESKYSELFQDNQQFRARPLLNRQDMLDTLTSGTVTESKYGTENVVQMMMTHYDVSLQAETLFIPQTIDISDQMSLRTFVENVTNLAIENCLLCDISGIFTPRLVNGMTEERLQQLAAEPEEITSQRKILYEEIDALRQGLIKCQQHRVREITGQSFPNTPRLRYYAVADEIWFM